MSEQDTYADWTPETIGRLLAERRQHWLDTIPWPFLEALDRVAEGRLIDREAIDYEAAWQILGSLLSLQFLGEQKLTGREAIRYAFDAALGVSDE